MDNLTDTNVNRRAFVRVAGLASAAGVAAACAPAAAPAAPAPSAPAPAAGAQQEPWRKKWDETVAAANKEGSLVMATTVGTVYKNAVEGFQQLYPNIKVDLTTLNASALTPRIQTERNAGVYNWDLFISTFGSVPRALIPAKGLDPVRPLIFRGDVIDDNLWNGGFEAGFLDAEKQFSYAGFSSRSRSFWVNTEQVAEGEIKTLQDLLNPKWKGKMITLDPRVAGSYWPWTIARLAAGDDYIRRIFTEQQPTLIRDLRQASEEMIRGKYAIGVSAPVEFVLEEFLQQGIGKQLKFIEIGFEYVSGSNEVAFYPNRAPHPNAATVFVNWLLTKEGSEFWSKTVASPNSRRKDVPAYAKNNIPTPGQKYVQIDAAGTQDDVDKTIALCKEVIKYA